MDLWTEASYDHEAIARQGALDAAEAELSEVFPFLAAARSEGEYAHRRALAEERLTSIALHYGLDPADLLATADRRYQLLVEALMEGEDPLQLPVADAAGGSGFGSGPETPYGHTETVDYSHGYAEVPQGAPGGPDPSVTVPREMGPEQVQEATGSLHTACSACGCGTTGKGKCKGCKGKKGSCSCGPDSACGGMKAKASMDSVRRQVLAVTASVKASNPAVSDEEAGRIARRVVGRYLTADLSSSVVSGDPGGNGGGNGTGGGGNLAEHMLEGQGLRSMIPGGAGAAAGVAEDAALAAL